MNEDKSYFVINPNLSGGYFFSNNVIKSGSEIKGCLYNLGSVHRDVKLMVLWGREDFFLYKNGKAKPSKKRLSDIFEDEHLRSLSKGYRYVYELRFIEPVEEAFIELMNSGIRN